MTGCKSTLSRKVREREKQIPPPERRLSDQHDQHELYRYQLVQELWKTLDIGRKTVGNPVEEHTTIPPVTATHRKARDTGKAKGKASA